MFYKDEVCWVGWVDGEGGIERSFQFVCVFGVGAFGGVVCV
jgi:hypothetical protein